MNQEQLNAIKQRAEKAEEGMWYLGKKSPNGLNNIGVKGYMIGQIFDDADAEFIAHAREDVPALVAEVERLREALTKILDYNTFDLAKFETEVIEIARQALADETK